MASKGSPRKRSTYGNLAYELDTLARQLDKDPDREIEYEPRKVRKVERPQEPARQPKVHNSFKPKIIGCCVIIGVLIVSLLIGYVQLTKVSAEISSMNSEIKQLKEEQVELISAHEKAFDMNTIKSVAEAAGMTQPSSGQIEYIDISVGDSAVVYGAKKPDVVKTMLASASGGILSIVEFFR